jgi:hypothetical protein
LVFKSLKVRNRSLLRFSFGLLIFFVLTGAATLLLWPLEEAMRDGMVQLRDYAVARAETYLGRNIEYRSIGPSLFGILDIRDIRIYGGDPGEPVIFIPRFRLFYSLRDLIGDSPLESLRSVRIDRPVINLDMERDADLLALFSSPSGFNLDLLPRTLSVRIRGGACGVVSGENRFSLTELSLDASLGEGISLRGSGSGGMQSAAFLNTPISLDCRVDGEVTRDLQRGSLTVTVSSLKADMFSLRSLTAGLTLADNRIELRKIRDRSPFDLYLGYELDTRRFRGEFRAEEFAVRELASLSGPWSRYNRWLGIRSSGFASLEGEAGKGVAYRFDLTGTLPPGSSPGPVSYALAGQGDGKGVAFDRCFIGFPRGTAAYTGRVGFNPWAPSGRITLRDLSFTGDGGIDGEFAVSTRGREISLFAENLSLGRVSLSALDAGLVWEDGGCSFSLSALRFRDVESYENVRLSSVDLSGSMDYEPRNVQASFELNAFALSDLADMVRPLVSLPPVLEADALGDMSVTTEVFITTDFEHILYNAPRFVMAYEGRQDIFTVLSISGTDRRFELTEANILWPGGTRIEASGYADFSNPLDISFAFQVSYLDLVYYFRGVLLDRRSLSVQGSYGFFASISRTDLGGYSGFIEAQGVPVPVRGEIAGLNLFTSLRYEDPSFWSLGVERFELASPSASLDMTAWADQDGVEVSRLFFNDGQGPLSGGAEVSWDRDFSVIRGTAVIGNETGSERLSLQGTYDGDLLDLRAYGSQLQLARVTRNSYNAVLTGEFALAWYSPSSYRADLILSSLQARIGETDLRASASGSLTGDALVISEVRADYGGLIAEIPLFRADLRESRAETSVSIRGGAMGRLADISFTAETAFQPVRSWFYFPRALNAFEGAVHVSAARLDALEASEPFDFIFSRTGQAFALSGGPRNMIRLQISPGGDFFLGLSNPSPIRGSFIGSLTSQTIDAQVSDLYVDLASLWRFIPRKDIIDFTGGFVNASVQIRGPLGDPEFFGAAYGSSVRIKVPQYLAEDIGPVPIPITLEGNEMRFGPVLAPVGKGAGTVSAWFLFDRWIPNTFSMDIEVEEGDDIPFALNIMGLMAAGDIWGKINLWLSDYVLTVSGEITGGDTEITLDSQEFMSGREPRPGARVSVATDLTVNAGRRVEFAWPQALPILRTYADAGSALKVTSDNSTGRFTLQGDIKLRSGEIYYFQRSFYLKEGLLSFNENEIRFNPLITARAEIRDRNDEGPVIISMIIDNAPLLSFTARFESTPPLSQMEIFSLLGQNLTGAPSDEEGGVIPNAFILASSDLLAQLKVIRGFERNVRNFLHLDMFSVRTQVLQNAMLQITGLRDPVDQVGVGPYFDNTTIFFGKYVRSNMFVQSMLSLRYDKTKTSLGGMVFEPDIGVELQSPLFAIRWNFVPVHYENIFMDDVSFSLTWRWTF